MRPTTGVLAAFLAGAAVLGAARGADAGEAVRIGGVAVPADCALARREHPRLLFTTADIPRLRERLKAPRLAKELAWAKRLAAEGKADAVLLGVLYHLTGEKAYLERARAKLRPTWVQTYPLAADLVMAGLTPAEQAAEADRIVEVIRANRWRPRVVLALAAWGHGHDDYLAGVLARRYGEDLVRGVAYNNLWSRGRGGSSMGHGYNGEHFYSEWFTMAVAWTNATGQDWVAKCDFAAHAPAWYLFHYRPWEPRPACVHVGVTAMCRHWQTVTPAKFSGDDLAVLAAARFRDGVGQWWVDEVISKVSMGWGTTAPGQGGVWGKLLWYDPSLPAVEPKMLPPARLFPENGHAVMRSDWTPGAVYGLFRCGRFGEIDGYWGRNNTDNLHFLIGRKGILAADTGAVHSLNNKALGFAGPAASGEGVPHVTSYARQTIAHNSITVGREPLVLTGCKGKVLGVVRRGGQSPIQDKAWWKAWGLAPPRPGDRPFREGRIVAYETSPELDYAAGDATRSYPPTRVKSVTRQFVYLRPDTFVVFDRVVAAREGLETIWNLHSLYQPEWNGRRRADTSLPNDRQFVLDADGKTRLPNPKPGGRYLHTEGDVFTIDDRWPGMSGRLFVKLLLPREGARTVRTIGGAWHDFEVNGVNYGPTEATYARHKGGRNTHHRENTIGVEGWRIEVSPGQAGTRTHFLTVLFAADQRTKHMPPVELVEDRDRVGAEITLAGKVCRVVFARSGPVGGAVTFTKAGKTTSRPLASTVEDHYGKWSGDPRYRAWTTRPEYRSFIGPLPTPGGDRAR